MSASTDLETDLSLRMLADDDGREMLAALDEPMTALELAEECEIPRSTVYRKIELLQRAGLVTEGVRVQPSGCHPATYQSEVADVHCCLEREGFGIELYGPDADTGLD